jgi:hypothetical protein
MKVTVWKQFSSNHSSHFTVVGEFPTPEAAQEVAQRLRAFFDEINAWFEKPENAEAKVKRDEGQYWSMSEPEQALSQQYGVTWPQYTLDWIWPNMQTVFVVDNLLFAQPPQSVQGGKPIADLLTAMGAKGMVHGDLYEFESAEYDRKLYSVRIEIRCTAPAAAIAQAIATEINTYFAASRRRYDLAQPTLPQVIRPPWNQFEKGMEYAFNFFSGRVVAEDTRLVINVDGFYKLGYGFPALAEWLRSKGCTDFQYTLEEMVEEDED